MNFTLLELNELLYCIGHTLKNETAMVNRPVARKLYEQLADELEARCNLLDMAENGPEPESMFDDVWSEGHDAEFERNYPQHQPKPAVVKELLDEAGAVQRWG